MKLEQTNRGFDIYFFPDERGNICTLQKSSDVENECIWLGAKDIGLKEFVAGRQPSAWEDVKLPEDVDHSFVANNRMHLTRDQVKELLPILQRFVETGEIS